MRVHIQCLLSRAAVVAFVVLFCTACHGGVTKARLGSLTRHDMVVVDVDLAGGVGTNVTEDIENINTDISDIYHTLSVHDRVLSNTWANVSNLLNSATLNDYRFRRIGPYLWEADVARATMDAAVKLLSLKRNISVPYAGSGICSHRYHGCNFDGAYSDRATVVVRVPATDTSFGVLGVSGNAVRESFILGDAYGRQFDSVAFMMQSGMNDQGVTAQYTVLPLDAVKSSGWRTPRAGSVLVFVAIRYVLERCATAEEAARMLRDLVYVPEWSPVDFHFIVSDRESSYIVEDRTLAYSSSPSDLITGFRVNTPYFSSTDSFQVLPGTVEQHGIGVERYNYVRRAGFDHATLGGIVSAMTNLWYTKAYLPETGWLTEHCALGDPVLTVMAAYNVPELFEDSVQKWYTSYTNEHNVAGASYRGGTTYQTVYTSIYDKELLTMRLYVQENTTVRTFKLVEHGCMSGPCCALSFGGSEFKVSRSDGEVNYSTLTNLIIMLGGKVVEE